MTAALADERRVKRSNEMTEPTPVSTAARREDCRGGMAFVSSDGVTVDPNGFPQVPCPVCQRVTLCFPTVDPKRVMLSPHFSAIGSDDD